MRSPKECALAMLALATLMSPGIARADVSKDEDAPPTPEGVVIAPADEVTDSGAYPAPAWLMLQLLPTLGAAWAGDAGPRFDIRWQITPLLVSFALDERLRPWHPFVASPLARHGGSVEAFVSPGWTAGLGWGARAGARAYVPLQQRGEYLSMSVSGYHQWSEWGSGWGVGAGVYVLFGTLGLVASWTPEADEAPITTSIQLRFH